MPLSPLEQMTAAVLMKWSLKDNKEENAIQKQYVQKGILESSLEKFSELKTKVIALGL